MTAACRTVPRLLGAACYDNECGSCEDTDGGWLAGDERWMRGRASDRVSRLTWFPAIVSEARHVLAKRGGGLGYPAM